MQPNLIKSESIAMITQALITFHVKVDPIKKDSENPHFHNTYASLANILTSINDALNESELSVVQFPDGENGLTSILMHTSGEYIQSTYCMQPSKNDPQGAGSAMTYMRRYAIAAILGLSIEEDDDGNAAATPAENKAARPANAAKNTEPDKWLNPGTKEFNGAVGKLIAGTTTMEKIRSVLKVSKATEAKLMALVNAKKAEAKK
jgi:hypothetical protein